jgi:hypothetical protein
MKINRNNYEVFLIDYIDGRLDPLQSNELLDFLSRNPDLKKEFDAYEKIDMPASKDIHIKKDLLKKNFSDIEIIDETNFDEFCVARLEGDLEKDDEIRLQKYIEDNPEKLKDYKIYTRLFLKPDHNIKYSEKNNIKKSVLFTPKRKLYLYISSAAAAIILFTLLLIPGKENADMSGSLLTDNQIPEQKTEVTDNPDKIESPAEKDSKIVYSRTSEKKATLGFKDILPAEPEKNLVTREEDMLVYLTPIKTGMISISKYPAGMQVSYKPTENMHEHYNLASKDRIQELKNKIFLQNVVFDIDKIDIWTAAEAGIKGFNYLTESEVELEKEFNNEGRVTAFALNSENFSISSTRIK